MERTKKEAAEKEQERLKQKENEQQQKLEAQERSFNENLAQLEEKIKKEQERLQEMLEKILDHYLRVSMARIRAVPDRQFPVSLGKEGQNLSKIKVQEGNKNSK